MSLKHGQDEDDDDDDFAANEKIQEHRHHFLFDEKIRNVLLDSSAETTTTAAASASSEVRPWISSSTAVGDREEEAEAEAAAPEGRFEAGRRRENRPPYLWSGRHGAGRRPKEIPFTFRHCAGEDTSRYIQQYRNDYTYANAAGRQQSVRIGDIPTETTTTTTASHRQTTDRPRPPLVAMGDREMADACCSSTRHSAPAAMNYVQQQKTTGDNSPRATTTTTTTTGNCQQPSSGVNGIRALISPRRVLPPLVVVSDALFGRARIGGRPAVVAVEGRRMEFADGPSISRGKTATHFSGDGYVLDQQTAKGLNTERDLNTVLPASGVRSSDTLRHAIGTQRKVKTEEKRRFRREATTLPIIRRC